MNEIAPYGYLPGATVFVFVLRRWVAGQWTLLSGRAAAAPLLGPFLGWGGSQSMHVARDHRLWDG